MDFRVLGPLEVLGADGGALTLGGPKQRAVLAALLVHANVTVSADRLVDAVWGEDPPASALQTLEVYVSRLRRALDLGDEGIAIQKGTGGYLFRAPPSVIDMHRFDQLAEAGRKVARDDPAGGVELLREALALWRGVPFGDVVLLGESASERGRLEELQLRARGDLLDLRLQLEGAAAVTDELKSLVDHHPFHERLRGRLMLALYQSGRQGDAITVYEQGRRALRDELGLSPSRELQRLATAIARHDAELDAVARPSDVRPILGLVSGGGRRRASVLAALAISTAGIAAFGWSAGTGTTDRPTPLSLPTVALVRWQAPQVARAPLEELQREGPRRAGLAYGVRTRVVAAEASPLGARRALEEAARHANLVIATVSSMSSAVDAVAPSFPRTHFAVFDTTVGELNRRDNVTGIVFGDEQAGFLAGYLAALMEQRRSPARVVVSAVAGLPVPGVERLLAGYEAGALAAMPNALVLVDYSGSWTDQARCEQLANRQIDRGAGVVFAAAGACGFGALQAAEVRGAWGIGVDEDQSYLGARILASAVKRFDRAVFSAVKSYVDRELPAGRTLRLDLRRNGVGLVGINRQVPPDIRTRLARIASRLRSGTLLAPTVRTSR